MKNFKIEFYDHPLILSDNATTYSKNIKDVILDIEKMGIDINFVKSISQIEEIPNSVNRSQSALHEQK